MAIGRDPNETNKQLCAPGVFECLARNAKGLHSDHGGALVLISHMNTIDQYEQFIANNAAEEKIYHLQKLAEKYQMNLKP